MNSFLAIALFCSTSDIVITDFETTTYAAGWTVTGSAFGVGPASGALDGQMFVAGYKGKRLVNSFLKGDASTGTLTSPEFIVERSFLSFLIGGGQNSKDLAINLIIDGTTVRTASGNNDKAGGSETLLPMHWDVRELQGKRAHIQIVDLAIGSWGHISVDQIVQTNIEPVQDAVNPYRNFSADKRYLHIPIRNGAPKRKVTLLVSGKLEVINDIELADDTPDWWAPLDISAWRGKAVRVQVDRLQSESKALTSIQQTDSLLDAENIYKESLRSQFHFSPRHGWINDPNGLVYYQGEYHLFFQHNPYGVQWGNMHWGHATSKDLVRWTEHGDVLAPDALGPMFSGSAVVDWNNTSGFGVNGKPPLVLIYTAAGSPTTQCLAYSNDGRSFTKYSKNPVLAEVTGGNRDPKVFWHAMSKRWVQVLYVDKSGHTVHFFTSPNLRDWTLASVTKGNAPGTNFLYECPDFFELPVTGQENLKKWVLMAANSEYALGTFDGSTFTQEQGPINGYNGRGFYAPQTFSDIPMKDGRRLQIGWMQAESNGMPFNQAMTIPLELELLETPSGLRVARKPAREMATLRSLPWTVKDISLTPLTANPLAARYGEHVEVDFTFEPETAKDVTLVVRGATIKYAIDTQELIVNGQRAPAPLRGGKQRIHVFCDRTILEVFASDGLCYIPMPFVPRASDRMISLAVTGGAIKCKTITVHELKSSWRTK